MSKDKSQYVTLEAGQPGGFPRPEQPRSHIGSCFLEPAMICECTSTLYVKRIFSDGKPHFGTQCQRCGKWSAIKKEKIPFGHTVYDYRQDLVDWWHEQQSAEWKKKCAAQRDLNFESMSLYYKSPEWAFKRSKRLLLNEKLFEGHCEICFKRKVERVHHLTYVRFGREHIFDLAAICQDCHIDEHPHMKEAQ